MTYLMQVSMAIKAEASSTLGDIARARPVNSAKHGDGGAAA